MTIQWITFLLSAAVIVGAGIKLASFGEALGRRTGIGQGWIGLVFLAVITSIPELTTTVTGAAIGAPNIAVGNALGSNLFNVAIIAVVDVLLLGKGPFLSKVKAYHTTSGGLAILLTALALVGILVPHEAALGGISPVSYLILIGYLFGAYLLYRIERREEETDAPDEGTMSLSRALTGFLVSAVLIIVAGIFLIRASKAIADGTGISSSLIGAVLVAIVTSLPELATSIGALKIGAYDMIVGNLFGSNMFNILTIFFADLALRKGSIFAALGAGRSDQLLVGIIGIGITAIAVIGIGARSSRRILGMGADAAGILLGYLAGTALIIARGIHL